MSKTYSIIDIETTGGSAKGNRITEIAIVNTDGHQILEQFSTLINPEQNIPSQITRLTGITNEMVSDAPKFYEVAKKIVEMTEGNIFVAHNVYFDFSFVKSEFSELGYNFQREKVCTVRLSRSVLPGHRSYSLGNLCEDLNIQIKDRHRALGDALATFELFKILHNKGEIPVQFEAKEITLPQFLKREAIEKLPELPGIYYFYSSSGELLYIGKSKNIKKRVLTHMRADLKRRKDIELKNQIAHIETKVTGHELAALILEAHEIKSYRPPFNHALKKIKFPYGLYLHRGEIFEIRVTTLKNIPDCPYHFGSKKSAVARRDDLYKNFLGHEFESLFFKQAQTNFVQKLGIEHYNQMLEKIFKQHLPKMEDFSLKLPYEGNKKKSLIIEVESYCPRRIVFLKNQEIEESIEVMDHPEIQSILLGFIKKYKINPVAKKSTSEVF